VEEEMNFLANLAWFPEMKNELCRYSELLVKRRPRDVISALLLAD
jgi:hypothetical protein